MTDDATTNTSDLNLYAHKPDDWIAARAIEHWQKNGLDFFICESPVWGDFQMLYATKQLRRDLLKVGRWCGYVRFTKLPGWIPHSGGIYAYVPVHGGITFFEMWPDGSCTYGFDCAHAQSKDAPIDDIGWMRLECESLGRGVQIAARFERYYLKAGDDNQKKARVIERMWKFMPMEDYNFAVMMNLLKGEL